MKAFQKNSWQFKNSFANAPARAWADTGNPPAGGVTLLLEAMDLAHSREHTEPGKLTTNKIEFEKTYLP